MNFELFLSPTCSSSHVRETKSALLHDLEVDVLGLLVLVTEKGEDGKNIHEHM